MSREERMAAIDEFVRGIFGPRLRRRRKLVDLDLTLGQLECLRLIGDLGSPSMSELSAELSLRPSSMTGLIDGLVQRGKVERLEDPADRRVVRVRLTEAGRSEREAHRQHLRQELMELLSDLSDAELERLYEALGALHAAAVRRASQPQEEP